MWQFWVVGVIVILDVSILFSSIIQPNSLDIEPVRIVGRDVINPSRNILIFLLLFYYKKKYNIYFQKTLKYRKMQMIINNKKSYYWFFNFCIIVFTISS